MFLMAQIDQPIDPSMHASIHPFVYISLTLYVLLTIAREFLLQQAQKIWPFAAIEYDNGNENSNMQIENKEINRNMNDLSVIHLLLLPLSPLSPLLLLICFVAIL